GDGDPAREPGARRRVHARGEDEAGVGDADAELPAVGLAVRVGREGAAERGAGALGVALVLVSDLVGPGGLGGVARRRVEAVHGRVPALRLAARVEGDAAVGHAAAADGGDRSGVAGADEET